MLRATDNDVCNACDGCISEGCEAGRGWGGTRGPLTVKQLNLESLRNYWLSCFSILAREGQDRLAALLLISQIWIDFNAEAEVLFAAPLSDGLEAAACVFMGSLCRHLLRCKCNSII